MIAQNTIGDTPQISSSSYVHPTALIQVNVIIEDNCFIGPNVSITHGAVVHGPCTIESGCLIGFNAVIYNAFLEKDVVILHNAVVEMVNIPARKVVPANGTVVYPEDFSILQEYTPVVENFCKKVIETYRQLTYEYLS